MKTSTELLIKPASGNCNLKCSYCFYADEQKNREIPSYGMMSLSTLETIVKKTIQNSIEHASFLFQGGEPTLAGLPFFKKLIEYEKLHNVNKIQISHSIQTNGYIIDEEWCEFFSENAFLVGLSIDGYDQLHDKYRVNAKNQGTHERSMKTVDLLKKYNIDFNIITVVNKDIAYKAKEVYEFYKEKELPYQQYIPCFDPLGEEKGLHEFSLSWEDYSIFLKDMFDCWYKDIKAGNFIYNRFFENLVAIIKGYMPESCGMIGYCLDQYVVESDGSVFPCDFYALDQFKLGNLLNDSFDNLDAKRKELKFVEESSVINDKCVRCKWLNICRGGCRRDRESLDIGTVGLNHYCEAYKIFFDYAYERLNSF